MATPSSTIPTKIPFVQRNESLRGYDAILSTYPDDILNRALKYILKASGYNEEANPFPGLYKIVNLISYGAVGDGVVDDTAAIQLAINSNPSATIIVGNGNTYKVTSKLTVPSGTTRVTITNATFNVIGDIEFLSVASTVVNYFTLERCQINATGHTTVGRKIIDLTGFSHSRIWFNIIAGVSGKSIGVYGKKLSSGSAPHHNVIDHNFISSTLYGVQGDDDGAFQTGMISTSISNNRITTSAGNIAIKLSRYADAIRVQNNSISTATGGTGIDIDSKGCIVTGNWLAALTVGINVGANAIVNQLSPNHWESCATTIAYAGNSKTSNLTLGNLQAAIAGDYIFPGDLTANGGYRQTIDGWYQDNIPGSQTNVEMTRAVGRFRAVRAGSITGVIVHATEARTAGTCTVEVYKNTGLAGAAGSGTGLTAVLDGTNTSRKATTQVKDTDTFAAGDELYLVASDVTWTPTTSDIRASIEIED